MSTKECHLRDFEQKKPEASLGLNPPGGGGGDSCIKIMD
jgi:hypothetical protein